ncbi:type IV secretory system conjugative DNA transfer family protein [Micromonospora sp.]|uniref:type IV secretory system conjugative DNA transfer family protein n=1 Tax=Micromonospora sp. TaxID=1876 RepID=UPI003B3AE871
MASGAKRRPGGAGGGLSQWAGPLSILAGLAVVGAVYGAVHLGASLSDDAAEPPPANPVKLLFGLIKGTVAWPAAATWLLAALLAVLALVVVAGFVVAFRRAGKAKRGDQAARLMGRGQDLEPLSERTAQATATRLGVTGSVGLEIACTVAGGRTLYQGWEDVSLDIWGPRQGKTSSRCIPAIVQAPGCCVVTSNKRDIVDATRGVRMGKGPVHVFDMQGVCDEPPDWYWNLLDFITAVPDRMDEKSIQLAALFFTFGRAADAKTDGYFEPAGKNLLANLLLAAAVANRLITDVYLWLTKSRDDEPVLLLKRAGYDLNAAALRSIQETPEKQRLGVYSTAQEVMRFLTSRSAMRWCVPGEDDRRPRFRADEFVRSGGTLYALSKEGAASSGPIVTALTIAVTEAAERFATASPGGRLRVPMVIILDEAANVCRWAELPNLYSHFGSRGIAVGTWLQSYSQGEEVWGKGGMEKLWGAATVKVVGSGVSGDTFLQMVSALIGDYETPTISTSTAPKSGVSRSRSMSRERIMDVSDLAALPKGRAVVIAAGTRPALCRTLPWMTGPDAEQIRASIARFDPAARETLADADQSAAESTVAATGPASLPAAR